jgi:hypothetical protein
MSNLVDLCYKQVITPLFRKIHFLKSRIGDQKIFLLTRMSQKGLKNKFKVKKSYLE